MMSSRVSTDGLHRLFASWWTNFESYYSSHVDACGPLSWCASPTCLSNQCRPSSNYQRWKTVGCVNGPYWYEGIKCVFTAIYTDLLACIKYCFAANRFVLCFENVNVSVRESGNAHLWYAMIALALERGEVPYLMDSALPWVWWPLFGLYYMKCRLVVLLFYLNFRWCLNYNGVYNTPHHSRYACLEGSRICVVTYAYQSHIPVWYRIYGHFTTYFRTEFEWVGQHSDGAYAFGGGHLVLCSRWSGTKWCVNVFIMLTVTTIYYIVF